MDDNLAATDVALTAEDLDTLDAASALPAECPGWMFATQDGRAKLLGQPGRANAR